MQMERSLVVRRDPSPTPSKLSATSSKHGSIGKLSTSSSSKLGSVGKLTKVMKRATLPRDKSKLSHDDKIETSSIKSNTLDNTSKKSKSGGSKIKKVWRKIKPKSESAPVIVQSVMPDMRPVIVESGDVEANVSLIEETKENHKVQESSAPPEWSIDGTYQSVQRRSVTSYEYYDTDSESEMQSAVEESITDEDSRSRKLSTNHSPNSTSTLSSPVTENGNGAPEFEKKTITQIKTEIRKRSEVTLPNNNLHRPHIKRFISIQPNEASKVEKNELLYKILVIGELGAGKTSIIKRYVHQFFSQHYRATIGVDFALKVLSWDANTTIRLQLWDIAGQERFGNMTRVYYKEAVGAFIVFDVTRVATFEAVTKWKSDLDSKVQLPDGDPIPCILLANKCDQQKEGIVNTRNKMDEFCKENKFLAWFETSAKDNLNIDQAANCLVKTILQNDQKKQDRDNINNEGIIPLDHRATDISKNPKKSCSC